MPVSFRTKVINRYYLHRYLIPFCKSQSGERKYSTQNTIAVFAQPRSGSTWLAEILQTYPKSIILNEPLWRGFFKTDGLMPGPEEGKVDELRKLNFFYYQPIPEDIEFPEAEDFFHKLFSGTICKLGLYSLNKYQDLKGAENFVIKFCYGNLLFHWLIARFPIKPVVLIRHPCSVVSSQLQHYAWRPFLKHPHLTIADFKFKEYFHPYQDVLKKIHSPEGILAAFWAINTLAITNLHKHKRDWYTLFYENLYLNTFEETEKLFNWLEKDVPPLLEHSIRKPSITTSADSKEILKIKDPVLHLGKWKKELSKKQISNIMHIVNDIGVNFYSTEELVPDNTISPR